MTKKPTLLKGLKIHELTICERPANQHSFATIFKSEEPLVESITKRCIDVDAGAVGFSEVLQQDEERRRKWKAREGLWPVFDAFQTSVNSTITDTSLSAEDRLGRIQQSAFEMVGAIREKFPDIEAELNKLFVETVTKETPMTDAEKAQLEELTKSVANLTAENAVLKAKSEMSDEEKKYHDSLKDEKAQEEFRNLDPVARGKLISTNKSADEVFKSADGVEIRKSEVGDSLFSILKSQNDRLAAQADEIAKANERAELVVLEKRASDEFGHLPGTAVEKAKVLKSIADLPEEVAKSLEAMLKAGEEALVGAFKMAGTTKGHEPGSPQDALEKKVDEVAKAQNISKAAAYDKVLSEFPELYDATQAVAN